MRVRRWSLRSTRAFSGTVLTRWRGTGRSSRWHRRLSRGCCAARTALSSRTSRCRSGCPGKAGTSSRSGGQGLEIRVLTLTDCRNYAEATVEFVPGLNLVVGRNGQGKTNLVEAVNVACGLGSHRSARAEAMVRHGAERAIVSAAGVTSGREVRLDVEVKRTGGTRMLVNRVVIDRSSP